jgi:hypothetical protein
MPAANSFPEVHVTGVVHHWVRANLSGSQSAFYLGTAEVTPQMQIRKYKTNVMNDIAGRTLPFQKTYDGEAAVVSTLLTRWSKYAYDAILNQGKSLGLVHAWGAGSETRWSRGALVYGQLTFEMWQVFDNSLNTTIATPGLELGYYWPQVEILDHDTVSAGTGPNKLQLVLDCTPYWIRQASHGAVIESANERGFLLYSNHAEDFPLEVLTPQ